MFPVGSAWLRVRSRFKAKPVFELLMAAMTEDVGVSWKEQKDFQAPKSYFILEGVYMKQTVT